MSVQSFKGTVLHLPESERPRERLYHNGVESLTSIELIAIVLGKGSKQHPVLSIANQLLTHFYSIEGIAEASVEELCQVPGMGKVKAIQLKAAIGLGIRAKKNERSEKQSITSPEKVYHLVREQLQNEKREVAIVVLLDGKRHLIKKMVISIGTLSQTFMHPREIFSAAIRHHAAGLILVHNHPSGDPTPSPQDLELTERLIEVGEIVGIKVLDHIIIGAGCFISIKNK